MYFCGTIPNQLVLCLINRNTPFSGKYLMFTKPHQRWQSRYDEPMRTISISRSYIRLLHDKLNHDAGSSSTNPITCSNYWPIPWSPWYSIWSTCWKWRACDSGLDFDIFFLSLACREVSVLTHDWLSNVGCAYTDRWNSSFSRVSIYR